jgi:hypothetical protein
MLEPPTARAVAVILHELATNSAKYGALSGTAGEVGGVPAQPTQPRGRIRGFDHVALPMANADATVAFYKALGCDVNETPNAVSVYFGDNMVNFQRAKAVPG